jgi:hypothetical protein
MPVRLAIFSVVACSRNAFSVLLFDSMLSSTLS